MPVLPPLKDFRVNFKGKQYYLVLIFFAHLSKAKPACEVCVAACSAANVYNQNQARTPFIL